MIRNFPAVRALCERMRRPATVQILAGLVLMAPAGLMTMRDAPREQATTEAIELAAIVAVAPAARGAAAVEAAAVNYADEYKIPTSLAKDIRMQIKKVFGGKVFKTVITKSVRLEESPAYKESIFTYAPDSTGASEYYSLCEEVIDRA